MMEPLISVIVPVYKVEQYLSQCVNSILVQTYRNLEIILVDDGSPDCCPQICDEYAKKDSRVRVIHQKNAGVSAARNAGLDCARGEYIGFVDNDDFISPVMFENLLGLMKRYRVQIAMCRFRKVITNHPFDDGQPETGILPIREAIRKIVVPGYYNGSLWNKLFDGKLLNDYTPVRLDPDITVVEDLLAVIQCLLKVETVAYTTHAYYQYRLNSSSVTHRFSQKSLTSLTAWRQVVSMFPVGFSQVAKAVYSDEASNLLNLAYDAKGWKYISFLKRKRSRYLRKFREERRAFPSKDRIRVWGTGPLTPVFCRVWNALKRVRLACLSAKYKTESWVY